MHEAQKLIQCIAGRLNAFSGNTVHACTAPLEHAQMVNPLQCSIPVVQYAAPVQRIHIMRLTFQTDDHALANFLKSRAVSARFRITGVNFQSQTEMAGSDQVSIVVSAIILLLSAAVGTLIIYIM